MTFQPNAAGDMVVASGAFEGIGLGTNIGITAGDSAGMDAESVQATHDKDTPAAVEGGNVGAGDVGQGDAMGSTEGTGMDTNISAVEERADSDDNSRLDPRILMESSMGGGGWGGVGSSDVMQQSQQGLNLPQSQSFIPQSSGSNSTSPWLVSTPPPPSYPLQFQSPASTPTTSKTPITSPPHTTTPRLAQHPYFSSLPLPHSQVPSLTYQQPQSPHSQTQSQTNLAQQQLQPPQQPQQPPLRQSAQSRPEVFIQSSNLMPDTSSSTFSPISQNAPRSRSGSASPWAKGKKDNSNNNGNSNTNANSNVDGNGSSSSAGGSGDTNNTTSGFGSSSALTYDSFWSGFRGSMTPTAMASLPSRPSASTPTPSSTSTSNLSLELLSTTAKSRTSTNANLNMGRASTTTMSVPTTVPAVPAATSAGLTPGRSSPFDMDMSMSMNMNINMGMVDGGMNLGIMGIGMSMGVIDNIGSGGGIDGRSYGFGR
jgi:hypothetical protein